MGRSQSPGFAVRRLEVDGTLLHDDDDFDAIGRVRELHAIRGE